MVQTESSPFLANLPKTKNLTVSLQPSEVSCSWYVIDAKDLVLGRLAVIIADILRGKNLPTYTPHVDCGSRVIVINADKVGLTGRKEINKIYYRHTGHPGGIKTRTPKFIRTSKTPCDMVKLAVRGMLGRGPMSYKRLGNLYLYSDSNHPHEGQLPTVLDVKSLHRKNAISQ